MKTKDWPAIITPRALLIGENATLQWSDQVIEYVMFLDYYFTSMPYDHGERSRYMEAKSIFNCISDLTAEKYRPQEVYGTNLCMNTLERPPHGKRLFIPEKEAVIGLSRINKILKETPTIEVVFCMSLQVNYYLQKLGFYGGNEAFLHGAQPRTIGATNYRPYYQPVNAKVLNDVIGNVYEAKGNPKIKVIPILPAKDYPLMGANIEKFGDAYQRIADSFK